MATKPIGFFTKIQDRWSRLQESDIKYAFMITALIFVLRLPNNFFVNNFWAEDGKVFFHQDYNLGPMAFFEIYAGYLHTLMRVVAFILGFLPLLLIPVSYKIVSLVIQFLLPLYASSTRWNFSIQQRFLMVLLTGALPHGGEIFGNMANQMTTAGLLIVIFVTIKPATSRVQRYLEGLLFFICAMTGPFILMLTPFIFVRFWVIRKSFDTTQIRWVQYLITATVTSVALHLASINVGSRLQEASRNGNEWLQGLLNFLNPLLLSNRPAGGSIGYLIGLFVIWFIWKTVFSRFKTLAELASSQQALWALYGMVVMASAYFVNRQWPTALHPFGGGMRYFYLPYLLILWAIVTSPIATPRMKKVKNYFLAISLITSLLKLDSIITQHDYDFSAQVQEFEANGTKEFKISPAPWTFVLNKSECWRCKF